MPSYHFSRAWIQQQRRIRADLVAALDAEDATETRVAVCHALRRYEAYFEARSRALQADPSRFLAAPWATPLERAVHWYAGWRPVTLLHILYKECGARIDSQLQSFLDGGTYSDRLGILTADQLLSVDALQQRTVREEDDITRCRTELQDGVGMAGRGPVAELELVRREERMRALIGRAEELRISTLRQLVAVLEPGQALDFLVATADYEIGLGELEPAQQSGRANY